MATPNIKDPKKESQKFKWGALGIYILVLYIGFHFDKVGFTTFEDLDKIFQHTIMHPFDIFPVSGQTFFISSYIAIIIIALIHVEVLRRRRLRTKDEYGSAAWYTDFQDYYKRYADTVSKSIKIPFEKSKNVVLQYVNAIFKMLVDIFGIGKKKLEINTKPGNKNMIFSEKVVMSMDTRKTLRNNNVLIIGGSGSGKTRFNVKPNLLQGNCSYVITDPSGEILSTIGPFLKKEGYKIKIFNLVQMDKSHSYNPFQYIRDEQGVLTMITTLIKNTTPKGSNSNDPFWEKAETALLQAICFYLYYECNMEDRNFSNVMKLLRCAEVKEDQEDYESTLDIMFQELEKKDKEHIAVRQYAVFKQAAGKTAKSILVSASVRLTIFNMRAIERLTGTDTINLNTIGDEKTALFCITPIVDTTYNFLVAMMYTQLFESLYFHAETECPGKRLPIHVRFMLDEFANIGTIPEFEQKLSTMRKYEISCTIIIQNMAQLKTMYKDSWESITGNCDTIIFLGGKEQATLKYISEELGKETIVTQTDTRSFGKGGGSSRNKNIIGRELMTPTEIGQMSTMSEIIMIRGEKPFFDNKYDYPKHPNYKYTGDYDDSQLFNLDEEFKDIKRPYSRTEKMRRNKNKHSRVMRAARNREMISGDRPRRTNINKKPLNEKKPVTPENLHEITGATSMKELKDNTLSVSVYGPVNEEFAIPQEAVESDFFNKMNQQEKIKEKEEQEEKMDSTQLFADVMNKDESQDNIEEFQDVQLNISQEQEKNEVKESYKKEDNVQSTNMVEEKKNDTFSSQDEIIFSTENFESQEDFFGNEQDEHFEDVPHLIAESDSFHDEFSINMEDVFSNVEEDIVISSDSQDDDVFIPEDNNFDFSSELEDNDFFIIDEDIHINDETTNNNK